MCEYCSESEITVEKLPPSDEELPCEWISEEFGPGACEESATYSVSDWFVEDHLCETHKRATEKAMQEGLGDFLESAGFRAEFEIRPIQQEEECDYMDLAAADWKPCGQKASYAKYILDVSLYCAEHAAEAGGDTEKK